MHAVREGNAVEDIIDPASIPEGVNPLSIAKGLVAHGH